MQRVAFLDRDGVINQDLAYVHKREDFHFIPGCIDALKQLQAKGFLLIVVTNQSGIGRGYYTEQDYYKLTQWYLGELKNHGVIIERVYHCPHTPEQSCLCRKPGIGMFMEAANEYDVDFERSLMVGDKLSDMEAARAAGIKQRYLVGSKTHESGAYQSCADLLDCINYII